VIQDQHGERVSQLARIAELKETFRLHIDQKEYDVSVTGTCPELDVLQANEVYDLCTKAYYQKIRARLASQKRHFIPYNEYLSWCHEYGLSTDAAKELSQALHLSGEILHFKSNPELKNFIFLQPGPITSAVTDALALKYIKRGSEETQAQLNRILDEYIELDTEKRAYDKSAHKASINSMRLMFGGVVGLFSALGHMVWVDFNWDIMEPVTYFVFLGTMIMGYTFFVKYQQEFTYNALQDRQRKKALRRLYLKNEFNWRRWKELDNQVQELKSHLGSSNVPVKRQEHLLKE